MKQIRLQLLLAFPLLLGSSIPFLNAAGSTSSTGSAGGELINDTMRISPVSVIEGVQIATNLGTFAIRLRPDVAPGTVENFLAYVNADAYDGTIFHRSVANFVVQGGGFSVGLDENGFDVMEVPANDPIENEYNLSNVRGTVAMAKRGNDPDSATNQWFVSVTDNSGNLDSQNGGFTVFGEVMGRGMEVVDAINDLTIWNAGPTEANPEAGLHPAFDSLPLTGYNGEAPLRLENFVTVHSADVIEFDFLSLSPGEQGSRYSFWLGGLDDTNFDHEANIGWIRHEEHGWLYAGGNGYLDGVWLWDDIQQDWFWTKHDLYPFLFRHNGGEGHWVYYQLNGTPEERDFYDYRASEERWITVP